jgi:hypothetical protein
MPLRSKAEVQFLQRQKVVSKSYEYKLKSIIKKRLANLMEKELPLLSYIFPNLNLTEISKNHTDNNLHINLTKKMVRTVSVITLQISQQIL